MKLPKWATTVTHFSKYLALIIFLTFPIIGFILGMNYQKLIDYSKIAPTSISSSFPISPTLSNNLSNLPETMLSKVDTTNWLIKKEFNAFVENSDFLTFKYPSNWKYELANHGGHPNLAWLFNSDKSQCLAISIWSTPNDTTLDDMLLNSNFDYKNFVDYDNNLPGKPINSLVKQINGLNLKIETQKTDNREFLTGSIFLGKDSRYPSLVYALISTCGDIEKDIFTGVIESVKLE